MGSISFEQSGWLMFLVMGLTVILLIWLLIRIGRKSELSGQDARRALWFLLVIQIGALITQYTDKMFFSEDKLSTYLLPPHNQIFLEKMIQSVVTLISGWAAAAILFLMVSWLFKKVLHGNFFQSGDPVLLTIGAAAVGWPSVLIFLGITFILSIVGMIGLVIIRKRKMNDRMIITHFILPAAILTMVFQAQLLALTHLGKISF